MCQGADLLFQFAKQRIQTPYLSVFLAPVREPAFHLHLSCLIAFMFCCDLRDALTEVTAMVDLIFFREKHVAAFFPFFSPSLRILLFVPSGRFDHSTFPLSAVSAVDFLESGFRIDNRDPFSSIIQQISFAFLQAP